MAEARGRNQQRRLHFVTFDARDQLRHGVAHEPSRMRNETAETPEDRIELADDAVALKLKQASER